MQESYDWSKVTTFGKLPVGARFIFQSDILALPGECMKIARILVLVGERLDSFNHVSLTDGSMDFCCDDREVIPVV